MQDKLLSDALTYLFIVTILLLNACSNETREAMAQSARARLARPVSTDGPDAHVQFVSENKMSSMHRVIIVSHARDKIIVMPEKAKTTEVKHTAVKSGAAVLQPAGDSVPQPSIYDSSAVTTPAPAHVTQQTLESPVAKENVSKKTPASLSQLYFDRGTEPPQVEAKIESSAAKQSAPVETKHQNVWAKALLITFVICFAAVLGYNLMMHHFERGRANRP